MTGAIEDGHGGLAQRYELIPDVSGGLIGVHEWKLAAKDEALAAKLAASTSRRGGKPPARPE